MSTRKIWIDTDLAVGMKRANSKEGFSDVDDGYAILQLMKSNQVQVVGLSAVFGNTDVDNAYRLCQYMVDHFYHPIPVYKGGDAGMDIHNVKSNEAVEGMYAQVKREKTTLLAIGPATNVGLLLALYPECSNMIEEVILVAGRRSPKDHFYIGDKGLLAMDLNFDLDNEAFQILLQSGVKVTLCPYEISSKVWMKQGQLDLLSMKDEGCRWLASNSQPWLDHWADQGADGFNPFDVLASHYILYPNDVLSEPLNARLELHPDDISHRENKLKFKNYLICDRNHGYPINYCYDVVRDFHQKLINTF